MKTLYYTKGNLYCVLVWDTVENSDLDNYFKIKYPERIVLGIRTPQRHETLRRRSFKVSELEGLTEDVKILGYELVPYAPGDEVCVV